MQLTREELGRAGPCFAGWEETMIWSCLDGSMGRVFVDERQAPRAAAASIADFCFLAGRPDAALLREAAAVRLLAAVAIFIPINPDKAEKKPPVTKAKGTNRVRKPLSANTSNTTNMTAKNNRTPRYCRLK